jgi:hypothetical protein
MPASTRVHRARRDADARIPRTHASRLSVPDTNRMMRIAFTHFVAYKLQ